MQTGLILIDVRSPEEYNSGHYQDAINLALSLMSEGQLPNVPKDANIKVYCRSGGRAEVAKQILEQNGFKNVENIGGYV